jgi:hypothetical protein
MIWGSVAWLPDSHELVVVQSPVVQNRSCPSVVSCAGIPIAPAGLTRALRFDLDDPGAGWQPVPTAGRPGGWSNLELVGTGWAPHSVTAVDDSDSSHLFGVTIDTTTGRVVQTYPLAGVLSVDASGTNVLTVDAHNQHLVRVSLATNRRVIVAGIVAEAAW